MALPLSACFDYLVTVRGDGAPSRAEMHPDYAARRKVWRPRDPDGDPRDAEPGLAPAPIVGIAGATVTIGESFVFELDPGMIACLRSGDVLRMARTGCGGMGAAILRPDAHRRPPRFLAAAGAVLSVQTPPLAVWNLPPPGGYDFPERQEGEIEIDVGGERRVLRGGEDAVLGDFGVVVVSPYRCGVPGTDECVAVFPLFEDPRRDAVVASAKILATRAWHNGPATASPWATRG
jgi:hypothetical protein